MTPFGQRLRDLREQRGLNQKQLAKELHVSAAYLSALEHGRRPVPTFQFVQKVIGFFNIIWDEAEDMQRLALLSNPRVMIDTAGLEPIATETANLLAQNIRTMDAQTLSAIKALVSST